MKRILVYLIVLNLLVPNIVAASKSDKKSSSSWWKTAAAVGTAAAGALILVTGGAVAYEDWKKEQSGKKKVSPEEERAINDLDERMKKQQDAERLTEVQYNITTLSRAINDKLMSKKQAVAGPSGVSEEYIRTSSLIFSLLLKSSGNARADVVDVLHIVQKKARGQKYESKEVAVHHGLIKELEAMNNADIYDDLQFYLENSLKNDAAHEVDPEVLVYLWKRSPQEVENFITAQINNATHAVASFAPRSKIDKLVREIEGL